MTYEEIVKFYESLDDEDENVRAIIDVNGNDLAGIVIDLMALCSARAACVWNAYDADDLDEALDELDQIGSENELLRFVEIKERAVQRFYGQTED